MTIIYAIHPPREDHLQEVTAEMRILGAPTIQVVDGGDYYMALEGSHRLAAAKVLNLSPRLKVFQQDDEIEITGFDWYEPANWGATRYTAGEVAGELFSPNNAISYTFD